MNTTHSNDFPSRPDDAAMLRIVGANVADARTSARVAAETVSIATGISLERLKGSENAETEATMVEVLRIADALGVPPASLFEGTAPDTATL